MRSAPTTTRPTPPRRMSCATIESVTSVTSKPSRASSHAVRRAPCSTGPRLARDDAHALALLPRRADDAERRAVPARREGPGVAVREDRRAVGDVLGADAAHGAARRHVLAVNRARLGRERRDVAPRDSRHAIERPRQIDGGRPRAPQPGDPPRRRPLPRLAARTTPYAAAMPMAGAPRTASDSIAWATSSTAREPQVLLLARAAGAGRASRPRRRPGDSSTAEYVAPLIGSGCGSFTTTASRSSGSSGPQSRRSPCRARAGLSPCRHGGKRGARRPASSRGKR